MHLDDDWPFCLDSLLTTAEHRCFRNQDVPSKQSLIFHLAWIEISGHVAELEVAKASMCQFTWHLTKLACHNVAGTMPMLQTLMALTGLAWGLDDCLPSFNKMLESASLEPALSSPMVAISTISMKETCKHREDGLPNAATLANML